MTSLPKHFDIHGHVNFYEYDADREEVLNHAEEAGVGMITVGTSLASSRAAVALAEAHEHVWAVVGIHPIDTHSDVARNEFDEMSTLARHPKVVAIGECGLDYFHAQEDDLPRQRELFERHIALANEVSKPLMLHIRNAHPNTNGGSTSSIADRRSAYEEAIEIVKRHAKVRANFHFFAGSMREAHDIVAMGNTMSFSGVITFARNYDEIIKSVPLANIMSETDCPYVAPVPYRGKRNEPAYVVETIKKIAEIRGQSLETVSAQLRENAMKLFRLD